MNDEVHFQHADKHRSLLQVDELSFWDCVTKHTQSTHNKFAYLCNISRKTWEMKLILCLLINVKVFYKMIVSFWVRVTRHAQSTQDNKFAIPLQYVKEDVRDKVDFLHADKRQKFLQINSFILGACGQACPNYSKTSLLFLCNILRKRWVMKLIFLNADKHESLKINIKIDTVILMGMVKYSQSFPNSKFAMSLQYLKVDFNTLGIKISYKVILSLLMGMTTSSQSTQSNKFTISLQCLEKHVLDGVHFLHADKHQNFYKLPLLFLMKVAKHVQSTQNRKLVIFLQCIKKCLEMLLCSILLLNIQTFYRNPVMFVFTCLQK